MKGDVFSSGTLIKRVCKSCNFTKRADCFSVADRSGNRRGVCNSCINYKKHPEQWMKNCMRKKLYARGKRQCTICLSVKELCFFHNDFKGRVHNNKKSYCADCGTKMTKSYVSRNRHKKAKWDKTYRQTHREVLNERYYSSLKSNPQKKIAHSLRTGLQRVLKRKGQTKVGSVIGSIGCSKEQLVSHIEGQFYPNRETGEDMTWDNHGQHGWHIDHIRPLCSFDLEDPEDFAKASHYSNLQPLWAKENLSKNGRWGDE